MTVRVLSDKPVKPKRVLCSKCTYELEYTGCDVNDGKFSCMGESTDWSYIVCPKCDEKVEVKPWRL